MICGAFRCRRKSCAYAPTGHTTTPRSRLNRADRKESRASERDRLLAWDLLSAYPPGGYTYPVVKMLNDATKKTVLARIRRIAGQLEGIARMIEEDRYCVDVLLQIASAQAALGQAGKVVLRSHVEISMTAAMATGKRAEREQKLDELMEVFARYGNLGRGR